MKKTYLILVVALVVSSLSIAQNFTKGTISLITNEKLEGKVYIDNDSKTVLLKNGFDTNSYSFERIQSVQTAKEKFTPLTHQDQSYLAQTISDKNAKAVLYSLGNDNYFIANGEVAQSFNIKKEKAIVPGTLSLLFSDCNDIRADIEKKGAITKEDLIALTIQYNNCSYSAYAPTQSEVNRATKHNTDQASFYAGIGANLNNVSFFDNDDTESLVGAQLRAGVEASPSFLGSLQGNLYAYLEGSVSFSGDQDFSNNENPVNFSTNSYRFQLGLQYLFNKTGTIKPFIGVGAGVTADAFSGGILENRFDIDGGNPILAPRAGVRFKLKNEKHLGLIIEYITEYENDLTFPTAAGVVPLIVNSQNISIGLNYYF